MLSSTILLSILVVDDEASMLRLLGTVLEGLGHTVGLASNGEEALALFRGKEWDLVLTDRGMPRMDGLALAHAIKALSPRTPLILMSGILPKVPDASIDAQLQKPFIMTALLEAIDHALAASLPHGT